MGYIILIILALVVYYVLQRVSTSLQRSTHQLDAQEHKQAGRIIHTTSRIGVVIFVGLVTLFSSFHQIQTGHIGIVYEFGAIRSQISEGPQFIAPWRTVLVANIQTQSHKFPKMVAFSEETQEVFIDATLNIRVSPNAIQGLYREVGPNYFDIIVAPRVLQNFKDENVKYKTVDIAPHRENIRHSVRERLEEELKSYSIEVSDLLLDNIDFNQGFKNAIEAKQIATQRALEEEQKVAMVTHQAEQAVEAAKGLGDSLLILATKQATANEKLDASLTDKLIRYTFAQKLGPNVEVMLLPAGQDLILGSDMLKRNQ